MKHEKTLEKFTTVSLDISSTSNLLEYNKGFSSISSWVRIPRVPKNSPACMVPNGIYLFISRGLNQGRVHFQCNTHYYH